MSMGAEVRPGVSTVAGPLFIAATVYAVVSQRRKK